MLRILHTISIIVGLCIMGLLIIIGLPIIIPAICIHMAFEYIGSKSGKVV